MRVRAIHHNPFLFPQSRANKRYANQAPINRTLSFELPSPSAAFLLAGPSLADERPPALLLVVGVLVRLARIHHGEMIGRLRLAIQSGSLSSSEDERDSRLSDRSIIGIGSFSWSRCSGPEAFALSWTRDEQTARQEQQRGPMSKEPLESWNVETKCLDFSITVL